MRLAHDRRGSGPPVVLLHGLGGTGAGIWKNLAPGLEAEFSVVTCDLRGAGRSEVPPGPYSLGDFVGDVRGLIEELGLERPALVGHSFGGTIALAYAGSYPEDVSAVVALGGPTDLPEAARQGLRDRATTVEEQGMAAVAETVATNGTAPEFRDQMPDEYEAFVAMLEANDPAGYAATCRAIADLDMSGRLERITVPVLLVGGIADGVAPPDAQVATAERIADAWYLEVPHCGHIAPLERPHVMRDEVHDFLSDRVGAAA